MIERDMRKQLVKLLAPLGAYAVENGGCHPGTPDIATTVGPIVCKATNQCLARHDTPVKLDHDLTQQQKIFIIRWDRVNGRAWVMLNVAGSWLLFDGMTAAKDLGTATKVELYQLAIATWERTPKTEELVQLLTLA